MVRCVVRRLLPVLSVFVVMFAYAAAQAKARVEANIDLSRQRMTVYVDGRYYDTWKVSTGRPGYYTPRGTFRPYLLKRMHYSRKYDNAPMPYSVFFRGGYAIHGTNVISRLGTPASHGCVRLHPRDAAEFFDLIKRYGKKRWGSATEVKARDFGLDGKEKITEMDALVAYLQMLGTLVDFKTFDTTNVENLR